VAWGLFPVRFTSFGKEATPEKLVVPFGQYALYLVVAALLASVAAILPARTTTRAPITTALAAKE
jgi:hypothetical protein